MVLQMTAVMSAYPRALLIPIGSSCSTPLAEYEPPQERSGLVAPHGGGTRNSPRKSDSSGRSGKVPRQEQETHYALGSRPFLAILERDPPRFDQDVVC